MGTWCIPDPSAFLKFLKILNFRKNRRFSKYLSMCPHGHMLGGQTQKRSILAVFGQNWSKTQKTDTGSDLSRNMLYFKSHFWASQCPLLGLRVGRWFPKVPFQSTFWAQTCASAVPRTASAVQKWPIFGYFWTKIPKIGDFSKSPILVKNPPKKSPFSAFFGGHVARGLRATWPAPRYAAQDFWPESTRSREFIINSRLSWPFLPIFNYQKTAIANQCAF